MGARLLILLSRGHTPVRPIARSYAIAWPASSAPIRLLPGPRCAASLRLRAVAPPTPFSILLFPILLRFHSIPLSLFSISHAILLSPFPILHSILYPTPPSGPHLCAAVLQYSIQQDWGTVPQYSVLQLMRGRVKL